jgi:hypothetical protein
LIAVIYLAIFLLVAYFFRFRFQNTFHQLKLLSQKHSRVLVALVTVFLLSLLGVSLFHWSISIGAVPIVLNWNGIPFYGQPMPLVPYLGLFLATKFGIGFFLIAFVPLARTSHGRIFGILLFSLLLVLGFAFLYWPSRILLLILLPFSIFAAFGCIIITKGVWKGFLNLRDRSKSLKRIQVWKVTQFAITGSLIILTLSAVTISYAYTGFGLAQRPVSNDLVNCTNFLLGEPEENYSVCVTDLYNRVFISSLADLPTLPRAPFVYDDSQVSESLSDWRNLTLTQNEAEADRIITKWRIGYVVVVPTTFIDLSNDSIAFVSRIDESTVLYESGDSQVIDFRHYVSTSRIIKRSSTNPNRIKNIQEIIVCMFRCSLVKKVTKSHGF